jgi:hypothetical protein
VQYILLPDVSVSESSKFSPFNPSSSKFCYRAGQFIHFIINDSILPVINEHMLHSKEMRNDFERDNLKRNKRIQVSAITAKLSAAIV